MIDSHPVFRLVWRLNALLILGLMTVAGLFVAYNVAREFLRSRAPYRAERGLDTPLPAADPGREATPQEVLHVGQFTRAEGGVFSAPVYSGTSRDAHKYVSGVKGAERVRNVMLFDSESGAVRRLFPDDKGRILNEDVVHRGADGWRKSRNLARVYIYVPADTNGDGRLDSGDRQRIVVTRPDGSQPVTLAEDVERYGAGSAQEGRETILSYFVRRGGELHYGEFDLASFEPGRTVTVKVPSL